MEHFDFLSVVRAAALMWVIQLETSTRDNGGSAGWVRSVVIAALAIVAVGGAPWD